MTKTWAILRPYSVLEKWLPYLFLKISSDFDLHFLQKANLQNCFCFDSQWLCRIKVRIIRLDGTLEAF